MNFSFPSFSPQPQPQLDTIFAELLSLSSDGQVNFPFTNLLEILSVFQRMHIVCVSISFSFPL